MEININWSQRNSWQKIFKRQNRSILLVWSNIKYCVCIRYIYEHICLKMTNHNANREIERPSVQLFHRGESTTFGDDQEKLNFSLEQIRASISSPTMSRHRRRRFSRENASTSIMFAPKTKPNTPKSSSRPNWIYRFADWMSVYIAAAATLINYQTILNNAPLDPFSNVLILFSSSFLV